MQRTVRKYEETRSATLTAVHLRSHDHEVLDEKLQSQHSKFVKSSAHIHHYATGKGMMMHLICVSKHSILAIPCTEHQGLGRPSKNSVQNLGRLQVSIEQFSIWLKHKWKTARAQLPSLWTFIAFDRVCHSGLLPINSAFLD